jgi:CrcB protein
VSSWLAPLAGTNVWATFAVNMTGALALGLLVGVLEQRTSVDPLVRLAVATGVLGGFTTFSTLMYEVVTQAEAGALMASAANLGGSLVLGLAAMVVGLAIGRAIG